MIWKAIKSLAKPSMSSDKDAPAPVRDPDSIILCIEDLKKSAIKKMPYGARGESLEPSFFCTVAC